jgi:serine/threonine-protein kinase
MSSVRYRVVKKIADGGMAEIFMALQIGAESFQKPVVLKRILPQYAADPTFVRMFVDEAHIASTLNHSNVVQILDLGKAGEQYFLALEFVDGWSLEQLRLRAKAARVKLPLPLSLYIVSSLLRALGYAHTRMRDGAPLGIVHRDVSPQNVLISREGDVKLADFGIAKAVGRREKSVSGVIKGKISYMSPEQSQGTELDARSDLFSVGTLLYLMTVGKKPFEGSTDVETLLDIRKARYERPSEAAKGFNADVERVITRALRVDVEKRWQTAEQMADRIDAVIAKLEKPTGASALKRWLSELSDKDGIRPPSDSGVFDVTTGTVQLGSGDLELQDVSPPPATPARASPASRSPARPAPPTPRAKARPAPGRRLGRWALVALASVVVLGAGWFFARPYLPAFMVRPVEGWLERLPLPWPSGLWGTAAPTAAPRPGAKAPAPAGGPRPAGPASGAAPGGAGAGVAPGTVAPDAMVAVSFRSEPDGATVRSESRTFGTTPFVLGFAAGRRYRVFIEKAGFVSTERTFLAGPASAQTVFARLDPAPVR